MSRYCSWFWYLTPWKIFIVFRDFPASKTEHRVQITRPFCSYGTDIWPVLANQVQRKKFPLDIYWPKASSPMWNHCGKSSIKDSLAWDAGEGAEHQLAGQAAVELACGMTHTSLCGSKPGSSALLRKPSATTYPSTSIVRFQNSQSSLSLLPKGLTHRT